MPLFTVTMKSNGSTSETDRLSRAIHAASIAAGYPEDDLFQRFLSLGSSDFRVDLCYPRALPKPRTDRMLMIEVLVSSGADTNRKQGLVAALVEKLGEAGIDPNDIMVFFLETDRASGSFGGGRFAPPVVLPSPDHHPWHLLRHGFEERGDVQGICFVVVDTVTTLAWSADPDGSATSLIKVGRTYPRDLPAAIPKGIRHRSLP